jgi:RNA polymerase sigma-70 factor, ECF subfamily
MSTHDAHITSSAHRDRRLVEALRLTEPTAAEDLVDSYGGRAYRLAIGITGNQPDAEEVVQDALWTVVRKIDTFTGGSAFSSWLYRIVANAAYDKLRGRRARRGDCSLDELLAMIDEHGDSVVDWSNRVQDPTLETDLRIALTAAIETLPEGYRTVVVLRDVEGLSTQEISQITGLSIPSVKVRTHRARLVLRKRLGAYLSGPQPPAARASVTRTDLDHSDALPQTALRSAGVVTGPRRGHVVKVTGKGGQGRASTTHARPDSRSVFHPQHVAG